MPVAFHAPLLRIQPRGPALGVDHQLKELTFESASFNESWHVVSSDGRFAEALVDQRMMAWLEGRANDVAFEVGGGWVMAEIDDRGDLSRMPDTLEAFVAHIPHVVASLYPANA